MSKEKEYRDSVLSKLENFLHVVHQSTTEQPSSETATAMTTLVRNLAELVEAVKVLEDSNAFVSVVNGIDDMLEESFFSKVRGPRIPVQKKVLSPELQKKKDRVEKTEKELSASAEKETNFSIQTHIIGGDSIESLPLDVRKKLAETLRAMGASESEINSQLKLGGQ